MRRESPSPRVAVPACGHPPGMLGRQREWTRSLGGACARVGVAAARADPAAEPISKASQHDDKRIPCRTPPPPLARADSLPQPSRPPARKSFSRQAAREAQITDNAGLYPVPPWLHAAGRAAGSLGRTVTDAGRHRGEHPCPDQGYGPIWISPPATTALHNAPHVRCDSLLLAFSLAFASHMREPARKPPARPPAAGYLSDRPAWAVLMILRTSAGSSATWNRSSSSGPMLPSASMVSLSQPSRPFQ